MRRLALCLAVTVAALVFVPAALADGGPFFVEQGGSGVSTHDGRFRYVAVSDGARSTIVEKVQAAGGQVDGWLPVKGSWGTAVLGSNVQSGQGLSREGGTLVLSSTRAVTSPSSFLVIDTRRMSLVRKIVLPGYFAFDAMSPDGSRMYLIRYAYGKSGDLTDYTVREYDLRTNRLVPGRIAARSDDGEEAMAGTPMTRTSSAGGRWVYTLYEKPSGGAFVHALDTVGAVAYCIDLPRNRDLYNIVLSMRDGGRTLALRSRTGRPWLNVAVGSWLISRPGGAFPWTWVGAGIGAALALLLAGGGVLLLRRRRGEEVEQHAGQELGLA